MTDQGVEMTDQGVEMTDQGVEADALLDQFVASDMDMMDANLCPTPEGEVEDSQDNDCDGRIDEDFILASDWISMSAGSYQMGNADEVRASPVHEVSVPAFQIMKTEVTVAQYRRCVIANVCTPPLNGDALTWSDTFENDHLPVNGVSWTQMNTFAQWISAEWAGVRLPTEAEWEYAARSQGQDVIYPWGNQPPDCNLAQYRGTDEVICSLESGVGPVCSTPDGNTTQGACDMAGNVYEWTLDEWHENFNNAPSDGSAWCSSNDCINPQARRVVRGGAWSSAAHYITVTRRGSNLTTDQVSSVGARLVRTEGF